MLKSMKNLLKIGYMWKGWQMGEIKEEINYMRMIF